MKPTWRTTGEYPLIAGVWCECGEEGTLVTIVQHGGDFVATASYKAGEETVSWRAEGKISKSGHITTEPRPHPAPPARQVAAADPHCRPGAARQVGRGLCRLRGRRLAVHWKLGEPREAEEKELSAMKSRAFLASACPCCPVSAALAGERKRFVFKIKTKSGGIVGNIVIEAKDIEEAKHKLRKRYPDCEILEGHEKK